MRRFFWFVLSIALCMFSSAGVVLAQAPRPAYLPGGSLQADLTMKPEPTFNVQHVVDALLYMAGLPLDAWSSGITPGTSCR